MLIKILTSVAGMIAMLVIVMTIAGVLKETGAMTGMYSYLKPRVKSKRGLVALMSLMFGVMPVPGRICFTCSILDSVQDKTRNNQKMGIIAHLASHHYYLWSPLEKAIIIVCGVLGISYVSFISTMWLPAAIMVAFSLVYIFNFVSEDEIYLKEAATYSDIDARGLWASTVLFIALGVAATFPAYTWYIFGTYAAGLVVYAKTFKLEWLDFKTIGFACGAVILGSIIGSYQKEAMIFLEPFIKGHAIGALVILSFLLAFAMGSSAKYAAICGAIVKVIGIKFLPLFYLAEFAGYLMSPSHDCVAIAKSYFKTPVGMFFVPLVTLSIILVLYGVLVLLF